MKKKIKEKWVKVVTLYVTGKPPKDEKVLWTIFWIRVVLWTLSIVLQVLLSKGFDWFFDLARRLVDLARRLP